MLDYYVPRQPLGVQAVPAVLSQKADSSRYCLRHRRDPLLKL